MKNIHHLDLDGRLLKLLVTLVETSSVTQTAQALGVTQSAVSHQLDRLRTIAGDELFVKSGRGIVATAHAESLAISARNLLTQLEEFVHTDRFDPAKLNQCITIAANDLQRDVLLPPLLTQLREQAPGVTLRVIPSDVPTADMLRDQECQLVISPRPPDATDIVHRRLFTDQYRVFFDPSQRKAPRSRQDFEAAEHVHVVHPTRRTLDIDDALEKRGIQRQFTVTVHHFGGVAAFIQGSQRIATLPGLLRQGLLRGLADAAVPVATPSMPMYAIWHLRHQKDPMHTWLRGLLFQRTV